MYEDSGSYRDFADPERYGINPKVMFKPDDNTKVRLWLMSTSVKIARSIAAFLSDFLTGKPAKTESRRSSANPDESHMTFRGHTATATVEHKFDNGIKIKNHTQYGHYDKFYQNVFANSALNQPTSIGPGFPTSSFIQLERITSPPSADIFNQTDVTAKVDMGPHVRHTLLAGVEVGHQTSDNQRHPASGNFGSPSFPNSDRTSGAPI